MWAFGAMPASIARSGMIGAAAAGANSAPFAEMPGIGNSANRAPLSTAAGSARCCTPGMPCSGQGKPKARTSAPVARGEARDFLLALVAAEHPDREFGPIDCQFLPPKYPSVIPGRAYPESTLTCTKKRSCEPHARSAPSPVYGGGVGRGRPRTDPFACPSLTLPRKRGRGRRGAFGDFATMIQGARRMLIASPSRARLQARACGPRRCR